MKRLHVVCGPTASGKTAFAIELALQLHTEIISADSRQVFRELPVGSAAPTAEEQARVPHHLVGHLSVAGTYDAIQFAADADRIIGELFKTHDDVVICGGSGLYIQALLFGFDEIPSVPASVREEVEELYRRKDLAGLHEVLQKLDPEFMAGSETQNPRRCMRALEVSLFSGRAYSSFKSGAQEARYAFEIYYPTADRETLYKRINERVTKMVQAGLEAEVRSVLAYRDRQALQTVGYKEFFQYFDGVYDLETCLEEIRKNTRRYAKRQETWFRHQLLARLRPAQLHGF